MAKIGNDIVDLNLAQQTSRWQDPRFLDKLFTTKEQEYIKASANPHTSIWRLWSIKEASYKLYIQCHPDRFYKPKAFACTNFEAKLQQVSYADFKCYVKTEITNTFVMATAQLEPFETSSFFLKIDVATAKTQSKIVRQKLLAHVADLKQLSLKHLDVQKNSWGIPQLHYKLKPLKLGVSISHHGRYGSYAIA